VDLVQGAIEHGFAGPTEEVNFNFLILCDREGQWVFRGSKEGSNASD
jgi:hypothetical protein